jgi:hypothetical protein
MLELCLQVADERGLAIPLPRLVPPDMVDRLIRPVFIDPLPRQARRRFDDLLAMSALFAGAEPFPSSLTGLPCKVEPVDTAWFEAALLTSLHYLAAMNNIGAEPLKEVA